MTETPEAPRLAETFAEAEDALLSRWPETRLEPSLDRIRALTELLGDPQASYPVIQLTGTNGKTSTSRMIDTLLRALDLRTGRFTSPHVERMSERISIDGEPLGDEEFVRAFNDVAPYLELVDRDQEHPLSFFETVVAMGYAAFADAPVDVAVVEVGMGGTWDATNVVDAQVAVVLPVAVDHAKYLGETPVDIALEKAGIIKPGSLAVLAEQRPEVAELLLRRAVEVGATVVREGMEFGVISRVPAVGGQVISLQGLRARYDEVFLPLYGAHQAQNAAVALAAVEAFAGDQPLGEELVRAAFAEVTSPGRL
jgi:dihydrofolate synthase / folylpolyglutamate synthase